MTILLAYWREVLIVLLAGSCLFSVRACQNAHEKVVQIQSEDRALAENAQAQADEQTRKDKEEYDNAKQNLKQQIDRLNSDHRVATVQCVRNPAPSSSAVPRETVAATGSAAEERADVPPAVTFDPGRKLDDLAREADIAVARCNALVDWVMATR